MQRCIDWKPRPSGRGDSLGDLKKVEDELGRVNLQMSIVNFAKATLIEKLIDEVANLEKVDAPKDTVMPV